MESRNLKEEILKLKVLNRSNISIAKELGCSRQIVSYHCSERCKENTKLRTKRFNNTVSGRLARRMRKKYDNFINPERTTGEREKPNFTFSEFLEHISTMKKCHITGVELDLMDTESYHCDHIIPVSRGGKLELSNLALASSKANYAKRDLTLDEFITLCVATLTHHGYIITT